jgi:PAS domain S-box-containing protein
VGLLAAVLLIAVVIGAWRLTVSAQNASSQATGWESVAAAVQADIAVGHLWLEEHLAGDRTVNVRRDIREPFRAAIVGCTALRNGGRAPRGTRVVAVDSGAVRRDMLDTCRRIAHVRALTLERLRTGDAPGSDDDRRFDAAFRPAFARARVLPAALRELGSAKEARLRRIEAWAIVALAVALLAATWLIRRGQQRLEDLLRERESVLQAAGEGILTVEPDGTIGFANAAAAILLGRRADALTGAPVDALLPDGRPRDGSLPDWMRPAPEHRTTELRRRDGTIIVVEYTATSMAGRAGEEGVVLTFRDVTTRRRLESERDAELHELRAIRATLVPAEVPERPELDMSTCFVAAESGVAGDFYLVADGPNETTVLAVGDVAGKGVLAAQRAAFVRTTLATFAAYTDSPARLLELANNALLERSLDAEMLVTAACVVVDPALHSVSWAVAGHPVPLRLDDGSPLPVRVGLPLGLEAGLGAQDAVAPLPPGAGLLMYTDGLSEARALDGAADRFGTDRISELIAGLPDGEPEAVVEALRTAAERFSHGALADDLCILAVRATGAPRRVAQVS